MLVGSIGYDCHSGLAHLMRDFYRNRLIDRVLITPHPHYPSVPGVYPQNVTYNRHHATQFLSGLTTLLLFEVATGNTWDIVKQAKDREIKIVLVPNYEYTPFPMPVRPDLIACASDLDMDYYSDSYNCTRINIPVAQKWRQRETALKFVHHAGHGQHTYAKGTPLIIRAMDYVKSPIIMRITGQPSDNKIRRLFREVEGHPRIKLEPGELTEEQLYSDGDVFVNAEQYNGMSLMLQEARAAGMLVISTNRYPMNRWLPNETLIPVERYEKFRICVEFDRAVINPEAIAAKIDEWYGTDITTYSESGREWAIQNSWGALGPQWEELLQP